MAGGVYLDKTYLERVRRHRQTHKQVSLPRTLIERVTSQSATSASTVEVLKAALEDWLKRRAADEGRG